MRYWKEVPGNEIDVPPTLTKAFPAAGEWQTDLSKAPIKTLLIFSILQKNVIILGVLDEIGWRDTNGVYYTTDSVIRFAIINTETSNG